MTIQAPYQIVIVAGQEIPIEPGATVEQIQQHLAATFPDIAGATVKRSTRTVDGQTIPVVEFVKRAGTKGLAEEGEGALLAALLNDLPADWINMVALGPLEQALEALLAGHLTVEQALSYDFRPILTVLRTDTAGGGLCKLLSAVRAEPGHTVPAGW